MRIEQPSVEDAVGLAGEAALFRRLGYPNRLAALGHLAFDDYRVRDLAEGHLVTSRPEGRAMMHALVATEVLEVLATSGQLLATTGDAVIRCPTYRTGVTDQ